MASCGTRVSLRGRVEYMGVTEGGQDTSVSSLGLLKFSEQTEKERKVFHFDSSASM